MKEYIRNVVKESGLVEKVKGEKVDLIIGSSGLIRIIEKANFMRWNGLFEIKEMEVSGFALGEGVIAEKLDEGIFIGLRKWGEIGERNEVLLDDKDLEDLEAACLLHNIGLINEKKKKILKRNHDSLIEFTDELKHKMRVLYTIIHLSAVLKEIQSLSVPQVELSHSQDCFKLVVRVDHVSC
uniref:Uncharacterized protein n=1 Tax=Tanacetum cinerariifolium TaxID=118510 RepID=A0A6L2KDZ6_TANCI|nr:hypothetical protein [Tanacetum cinerariifolium]